MKRLWLIIALMALGVTAAGAAGSMLLLRVGPGNPGGGGAPPVSCASTGVFDLSNVCNDIYFIGALK